MASRITSRMPSPLQPVWTNYSVPDAIMTGAGYRRPAQADDPNAPTAIHPGAFRGLHHLVCQQTVLVEQHTASNVERMRPGVGESQLRGCGRIQAHALRFLAQQQAPLRGTYLLCSRQPPRRLVDTARQAMGTRGLPALWWALAFNAMARGVRAKGSFGHPWLHS